MKMKLKSISTTQGGHRQFTLRLNEKELDGLFAALELSENVLPRHPMNEELLKVRVKIYNAKKELKKAKKELRDKE